MTRWSLLVALAGCTSAPSNLASMDDDLAERDTAPLPAPAWTLTRTIPLTGAQGAHYNPVDDNVYVGTANGLWRIGLADTARRIASTGSVTAVGVDPGGNVYFDEDVAGLVWRTVPPALPVLWIGEFGSSTDDDPEGFAFAPLDYAGPILTPGQGLVADGGYTSPDGLWTFSSVTAEGEVQIVPDSSALVEAIDVAIGHDRIFVADPAETAAGVLYELTGTLAAPVLTAIVTDVVLAAPSGIAVDPVSGDLFVTETGGNTVWRVDPDTGETTAELVDATLVLRTIGIDVTPDGTELILTTTNAVRVYTNCEAGMYPAQADCDHDGVTDMCQVRREGEPDCNRNRSPDACDLAGSSDDCDGDGRPDECPDCREVEVVFVMDTSASMEDEGSTLCANISAISDELARAGITSRTWMLGISDHPGGGFSCLTDDVISLLGTEVPSFPTPNVATLGACPGGNEVASEDWGRAVAVVAGKFWADGGPGAPGTSRVIVPIADEGPWCGDPVTTPGVDRESVEHAAFVARENSVRVYPVMGTGSSSAVLTMAHVVSDATGGVTWASSGVDLVSALTAVFEDACAFQQDCNENDVLDTCELAALEATDCNCNGVLDTCDAAQGITCRDGDGDGIGDVCDDCTDSDGDGHADPGFANDSCPADNCPGADNPDQDDHDDDGIGDACDPCTDTDHDGWADPGFDASTCALDLCPDTYDPLQRDTDADGVGDACDPCTDSDRDGFGDPNVPSNTCPADVCPAVPDPDQADTDQDGVGDACDPCTDSDRDGFGDPLVLTNTCAADGCPSRYDPYQLDADSDGIGDVCDPCTDPDEDGFGTPGFPASTCAIDNCPTVANDEQTDTDRDRVGDACDSALDTDADGFADDDNCPGVANPDQSDADDDGIGDACDTCHDPDEDGFGHPGWDHSGCDVDNCAIVANADQADADGDGVGDACDRCRDADGDGYGLAGDLCAVDNCPAAANADQQDLDADGLGDACDDCTDVDGDGLGAVGDACGVDPCPTVAEGADADADGDGRGDACDPCTDVDGDGYGIAGSNASCTNAGDDCDDADADIHPGADEVRGDGIDQDCGNGDAVADGPGDPSGECGCQGATVPYGPFSVWWLPAVVLIRRRR